MARFALIGDFNPAVFAHQAIPPTLTLAAEKTGRPVSWEWIATDTITDAPRQLAAYDAVWCVPASPYRSMAGALAAIRFARETGRPFLGTCGGFQHALIEFASDVAGIATADHAETSPAGRELVVTPLACSLVESQGDITFTPGSQLHGLFAGGAAREGYRCNYGVNPAYRTRLAAAGLRFTGFDAAGDIRAFELPGHRFFIGTLFQPERSALRGLRHPLIEAFVCAAGQAHFG
jgi:CTP synthase (UTP-ammonia lyase)